MNRLYATTIVITLSPKSVVIGADSRATNWQGSGQKDGIEICKIVPAGSYHFAVAGFYHGTRMNLIEIIKQELKKKQDFKTAIEAIKKIAHDKLKDEYIFLKKNLPKIFKERTENGKMVSDIAIVGIRDKVPFIQLVTVNIIDTTNCDMEVQAEYYQNTLKVLWLGVTKEITKYMQNRKVTNFTQKALVDYLINLEIKAHPDKISGPVDILELSPIKKTWHRKKPNCSDSA